MKSNSTVIITDINKEFDDLHALSNDDLRTKVKTIESQILQCENIDEALDESLVLVFAIVKETARRFTEGNIIVTANDHDRLLASDQSNDFITIKDNHAIYHNEWYADGGKSKWSMIHYDEQLLGGYYLHKGYAVEMATGEGKTLVATLPVFLNALTHQGVHLMTVNDYLSIRDYLQTRPLYALYGLIVDCIEHKSKNGKKKAYAADITFGTNSSFTFDYLFDNITSSVNNCVQKKHHFAIIDELDSILIDDACIPHKISGGFAIDNRTLFQECNKYVSELCQLAAKDEIKNLGTSVETIYYQADQYNRTASFTEKGKKWLTDKLSNPNIFKYNRLFEIPDLQHLDQTEVANWEQTLKINNALTKCLIAHTIYQKEVDYIVEKNSIIIIDSHTGRPKPDSRWSYGIHTAIEAKEGVNILPDHNSMAVISLKNYFKMYKKVCGMSGTISVVSKELEDVYRLPSITIPTHKPLIRKDEPLRVLLTKNEKDNAIVQEVIHLHSQGRPILIGTPTIKRAKEIANVLTKHDIKYSILDATTLKNEAYAIKLAGQENAITVATSVAGRGTDIKLADKARENGGLAVIATDLYESLRVEQQLCGRAGRQGDPGSSVTFVSLEDDILSELSKGEYNNLLKLLRNSGDVNEIVRFCRVAQQAQEKKSFKRRQKQNQKDDDVAPYRKVVYTKRRKILEDALEARKLLTSNTHVKNQINAIEVQLHNLATQIIKAVNKIEQLIPNLVDSHLPIPCVFEDKMFVIEQPIGVVNNKRNIEEIKNNIIRRIYLLFYDTYWMQFVEHLDEELSPDELLLLPWELGKMDLNIEQDVVRCLISMKVMISEEDIVQDTCKKHSSNKEVTTTQLPNDESLCPCGSGKLFRDCHGAHHSMHRRR